NTSHTWILSTHSQFAFHTPTFYIFIIELLPHLRSILLPYTTLFRSRKVANSGKVTFHSTHVLVAIEFAGSHDLLFHVSQRHSNQHRMSSRQKSSRSQIEYVIFRLLKRTARSSAHAVDNLIRKADHTP